MRLLDALKHLALGEGDDPETGLETRERSLSRALGIIGFVFVLLGFALFAMLYA